MASFEDSCKISIEGMTCQSCVQTIEANIGKVSGVTVIKVNLEKKEATVGLDKSSDISPTKVAELISDMGFDAKALDSVSSSGISTMTKSKLLIIHIACRQFNLFCYWQKLLVLRKKIITIVAYRLLTKSRIW